MPDHIISDSRSDTPGISGTPGTHSASGHAVASDTPGTLSTSGCSGIPDTSGTFSASGGPDTQESAWLPDPACSTGTPNPGHTPEESIGQVLSEAEHHVQESMQQTDYAMPAGSGEGTVRDESTPGPPACPCCGSLRHKQRTDREYRDLIARLNRIEGQIRGIKGMVSDSAYCIDILTQVSAATAALNSFSKVLLAAHIKSCVADDIRDGSTEKLDELIRFLPKMMK